MRQTRVPIPDDEPTFILRAKDAKAFQTLMGYLNLCSDEFHRQAIAMRIDQFRAFTASNPTKVKEPDSDYDIGQQAPLRHQTSIT